MRAFSVGASSSLLRTAGCRTSSWRPGICEVCQLRGLVIMHFGFWMSAVLCLHMPQLCCKLPLEEESEKWPYHQSIMEVGKPFKCDKCSFATKHRNSLRSHVKSIHHKIRDSKCQLCSYSASESNLRAHIRIVHLGCKRYSCEKCNYATASYSEFNNHQVTCQTVGSEEKFNCMQCDKSLSSRCALIRHVKAIHNQIREHKCCVCNKHFAQSSHLIRHINAVHRREKNYECSECDKAFSSKRDIQRHIRVVHRGLKDHKCAECSKEFSSGRNIQGHMSTVHKELKDHKCGKCDGSFSYLSSLKRHINVVHKE